MNIIDLEQFKHEVSLKSKAKNMVDSALNSESARLKTDSLNAILQHTNKIIFFTGDDRETQGKMSIAEPQQLINAASVQMFSIKKTESLNMLTLTFDGDYIYNIMLSEHVHDTLLDELIFDLKEEQSENNIIYTANAKSLVPGIKHDLSWLKTPLRNEALSGFLMHCEIPEIHVYHANSIDKVDVPANVVADYASKTLLMIESDPVLKKFILTYYDEDRTQVVTQAKDYVNDELFSTMIKLMEKESELNRTYVRENDPGLEGIIARMKKAAHAVSPEPNLDEILFEYRKTTTSENKKTPNIENVIRLKPR